MNIILGTAIVRSPRVMQIEGLFDLQPSERARRAWPVELALDERPWQVGLIVGPSGSGKTTIARRFWPEQPEPCWPADRALVDAFPAGMAIKEIVSLLS